MMTTAIRSFACVGVILLSTVVNADDVDFVRDIKGVLKQRCFACHGVLKQQSGLRLDTAANLLKGGDSGPVANPGNPDQSEIVQRVSTSDLSLRMPPEGEPLTERQIDLLKRWIESGARVPANDLPEPSPSDHWAFRLPKRTSLPPIHSDSGQPTLSVQNPIDRFINHQLQSAGLSAEPPADRATLLRRVSIDLIGIPPTREEQLTFLADESLDAYEKLVDRLLDSPRYGERWGRHWMDVWRYSDWFGRRYVPDVWNSAPQIWRWRDWIISSLNRDAGYDEMVSCMLAADEVHPADLNASVATGYLIRNWYALNPNDWMRNTVEHTGKAFLALTFNCAHCHDHKYDPIAQDDYFRLRAFFEPIAIRQDRYPGEPDPGPFQEYDYSTLRKIQRLGLVRIYDKNPNATTWFYTGGDERNRVKDRGSISPGVPAFLNSLNPLSVQPVSLPAESFYPAALESIRETIRNEKRQQLRVAEAAAVKAETTPIEVTEESRRELADAERELQAAEEAEGSSVGKPLAGKQSLLLDPGTGRRVLQNRLSKLTELPNGTTIEFQIKLLKDAHINFQLAKDLIKGLTASYVAFDAGKIVSYQPGGFTEFVAGNYDFARDQNHFQVRMRLDIAADRLLLNVHSIREDKAVVSDVPIALNQWNPIGDSTKGFSFDARPGSVAVVDELVFRRPGSETNDGNLVHFGFEPPDYAAEKDIVGVGGWEESSFGQSPSVSLVVDRIPNPTISSQRLRVAAARRVVSRSSLARESAKQQVTAAQSAVSSLESRLDADTARFNPQLMETRSALAIKATESERVANREQALSDTLRAELKLATAEALPATVATRTKDIELAQLEWNKAKVALAKADSALAGPIDEHYTTVGPTYPTTSTGRRKGLADWIVSPKNPLTARVAVNHIWMRHFHKPLVASVFDFGRNGTPPTHPELLDWLAVEFMESGWSMKHLHRLMVTSAAYRRSSRQTSPVLATRDPENRLLGRMPVGRMEAEVVRDSLLSLSGRLDPFIGGQELENNQALTTSRRSLYYCCQPEDDGKSPFGALFDGPEPADCYRRSRTIIPQQALALSNSELAHDVSERIATRLWNSMTSSQSSESKGNAAFVVSAFQHVLTRSPDPVELEVCVQFLNEKKLPAGASYEQLRGSVIRSLLNHNDFIAIR